MPEILRRLDDERQFSLLVLGGDLVAQNGGGKAALGTETDTVHADVPARLHDSPAQQRLWLKLRSFC